jgi:hypothetical protein
MWQSLQGGRAVRADEAPAGSVSIELGTAELFPTDQSSSALCCIDERRSRVLTLLRCYMRGGSLVTGPGVGAGAAAFFDLLVALGAASAATTGVGAGATGATGAGATGAGAGAAFTGAAAFTTGAATFFAGAATFAGAAAFTALTTGAATFFAGAAAFADAAAFLGAAFFFATFALADALAARRADVLRVELLRALARFDDFARAGLRADFVGRRVRFELAMARAPM